MQHKPLLLLLLLVIAASAFQCPGKMQKLMYKKIAFDYSTIDADGLRNGEVAVDYEFCIPAHEEIVQQVMKIDPGIRIMKGSNGRIGCSKSQWLCINTTHSEGWKDKLHRIAYLEYVDRIQETFYE